MMRLKIYITDGIHRKELLLPEAFAPQFEQRSPILDFNGIPGSYSTDLKIPVEGNEVQMRGVHHTDSADGDWIFSMELWEGDTFQFSGKIIVENSLSSSNEDNYDITLIRGDFASSIADVALRNLLNEEITLTENLDVYTPMKTVNAGSWPTYPYCFPMYYNEEHFGGANEFFSGWINPWSQAVQLFQQQSTLGPSDSAYENEFTYSPWLYLFYALQKILGFTGYSASGDWYSSSLSRKICIVSNYSMDRFRDKERIRIATDTDRTLSNSFVPWDEIIDNSTGDTPTGTAAYTIGKRGVHKIIIELNLGTFSGALTAHFKTAGTNGFGQQWTISGQNQVHVLEVDLSIPQTEVGNSLSLFLQGTNVQVLAGTSLYVHNVTEATGLEIERTINAKDLVPNISASELMVAIRTLGVKIDVNDTTREIQFNYQNEFLEEQNTREIGLVSKETPTEHEERNSFQVSLLDADELPNLDRFVGTFETLEDLKNSGGYATEAVALVKQLGAYMIFSVNDTFDDFEWQFLQKEAGFQSIGSGKQVSIEMPFKIVRCAVRTFVGEESLVPELDTKASGKSFGMKVEKGELTFCYYHGLRDGSDGAYPFASPFAVDYGGNTIATQSLSLVQEDGFFEQLWRPVLEVLQQNRIIEKQVFNKPKWTENPFDFRLRYASNEWIVVEITETKGGFDLPITVQLKKI